MLMSQWLSDLCAQVTSEVPAVGWCCVTVRWHLGHPSTGEPALGSVGASLSHGEEVFELLRCKINFINDSNCTRTGEHRYFPSRLEIRKILKAMPVSEFAHNFHCTFCNLLILLNQSTALTVKSGKTQCSLYHTAGQVGIWHFVPVVAHDKSKFQRSLLFKRGMHLLCIPGKIMHVKEKKKNKRK